MHICNVRSQVFFPGVWVCLRDFILFFFWQPWARTFTVGKHLALRNPSNMGKFSRNAVGKPGPLRRGKESTFDTGRRVETGTYHIEGRKPFIQTFDQRREEESPFLPRYPCKPWLVGGDWNHGTFNDFPFSWEFQNIPTDFHSISFQSGGYTNHQPDLDPFRSI